MNTKLAELAIFTNSINRRHIQVFFAVLALTMLVLGVGAPSDGGGAGRHGM